TRSRRHPITSGLQRPCRSERAGLLGRAARSDAASDLPGPWRARGGRAAARSIEGAHRSRRPDSGAGRGVRAVEMTQVRYQVGQRLRHPQFGEGLVVEVHTDRGREVLEVVFGGQLRRLSATRDWDIVDGDGMPPVPAEARTLDDLRPTTETATPRVWHAQGEALMERW